MVPRGCGVRRWQNVKQNLPLYWGSPWKVLKSCWLHTPFELKISPYFNGVFPFFWQTWRFTTGVVCSLQFAVCDGHGFRIKHLPSYSILDSRDPKEISPQGLIWLLGFPIFFVETFPNITLQGTMLGITGVFQDIRGEGPLRVMGSWCHFSRGRNKTSKTWAFQESPTSLTVDLSKTQGSLVKI